MSDTTSLPVRAVHGAGHTEEGEFVPAPRRKRDEADFDITPMIDVVFLLLIFFMVSSTMQPPSPADAPPARNGQGLSASGTINVTLLPERAGEYEVKLPNGDTVPLGEALEKKLITAAVAEAKEADPGKMEVVFLADRDATAEQTMPILRQIGEVEGLSYHTEVQDPR